MDDSKSRGNSTTIGKPEIGYKHEEPNYNRDDSNSRDATAGALVTTGMPQQGRQ
jgi:hypothetical protein